MAECVGRAGRRGFPSAFTHDCYIGFHLIFNSSSLNAQNCPTFGESYAKSQMRIHIIPAQMLSLAAGSTSITLGAAGSGTGFGTTPIAVGDIVLIIQMQGAAN